MQGPAAQRLAYDAGQAARFVVWHSHFRFERAVRGGAYIAGTDIGPGAALRLALASRRAGCARTVRGRIEVPVIAAAAIDAEFKILGHRLVDAGAAHAGNAAVALHARRHALLEPADRLDLLGARI